MFEPESTLAFHSLRQAMQCVKQCLCKPLAQLLETGTMWWVLFWWFVFPIHFKIKFYLPQVKSLVWVGFVVKCCLLLGKCPRIKPFSVISYKVFSLKPREGLQENSLTFQCSVFISASPSPEKTGLVCPKPWWSGPVWRKGSGESRAGGMGNARCF